jgi:multicomponent Na+:H+ antiporter subunit C
MWMWVEYASILVFFAGFYGVITCKSILKSIVSIGLMELAVVMFFLSIGFSMGSTPPISARTPGHDLAHAADPLPQALVITTIIMGVAVIAVNLTMLISLYRRHSTTDWDTVKKQNME